MYIFDQCPPNWWQPHFPLKRALNYLACWWRDPLRLTYNHDADNIQTRIWSLRRSIWVRFNHWIVHSCKCPKRKNLRTIWSGLKLEWITNNLLQFLGTKEQREVKLVLKPERKLLKFPMRKLMKSFIEINRGPNKSQIKLKSSHTLFSYANSSTLYTGIASRLASLFFIWCIESGHCGIEHHTGGEDVLGPLQTWTKYKFKKIVTHTFGSVKWQWEEFKRVLFSFLQWVSFL